MSQNKKAQISGSGKKYSDEFFSLAKVYFKISSAVSGMKKGFSGIREEETGSVGPLKKFKGKLLAVEVCREISWDPSVYEEVFNKVRKDIINEIDEALKSLPQGYEKELLSKERSKLESPEYEAYPAAFRKETEIRKRRDELKEQKYSDEEIKSILQHEYNVERPTTERSKDIGDFWDLLRVFGQESHRKRFIEAIVRREFKARGHTGTQGSMSRVVLEYFPTVEVEPWVQYLPSGLDGLVQVIKATPQGGTVDPNTPGLQKIAITTKSTPKKINPEDLAKSPRLMQALGENPLPSSPLVFDIYPNPDYQPIVLGENVQFKGKTYDNPTLLMDAVANDILGKIVGAPYEKIDPSKVHPDLPLEIKKSKDPVTNQETIEYFQQKQPPMAFDEDGNPIYLSSRLKSTDRLDLTERPTELDPSYIYNYGFAYLPSSVLSESGELDPKKSPRFKVETKPEPSLPDNPKRLISFPPTFKKSDLLFADSFTQAIFEKFAQEENLEAWYDMDGKRYGSEQQLLAANRAKWNKEAEDDIARIMTEHFNEDWDVIIEPHIPEGLRKPMFGRSIVEPGPTPPIPTPKPTLPEIALAEAKVKELIKNAKKLKKRWNEKKWKKAKEVVEEQYGSAEDNYALVMDIYKKMTHQASREIIETLISLANDLDTRGLVHEAGLIDNVLQKIAQTTEETDLHQMVPLKETKGYEIIGVTNNVDNIAGTLSSDNEALKDDFANLSDSLMDLAQKQNLITDEQLTSLLKKYKLNPSLKQMLLRNVKLETKGV